MKEIVIANISGALDGAVVACMFREYEKLITAYRKDDSEAALNAAGKFAEHVVRGIEGYRTGKTPPAEIKSFAPALAALRADANLPEPVRVSITDALSMIFNMRSKRGAAHVKPIDPSKIDAALACQAASWTLSELLRLFHTQDEKAVATAMTVLMRGNLPLIECFEDEHVVTTPLACELEILLQLARVQGSGLDRRAIGLSVKQSPSAITRALQRLEERRHVHQTRAGMFHITGPGEGFLGGYLAGL